MHTLIALVAAAAACAIARPSGPTPVPALSQLPQRVPAQPPKLFREYLMPRLLMPNFFAYDDNIRPEPPRDDHEWLNKEIDRLNQMEEEEEEALIPFNIELARWMSENPYMPRTYEGPIEPREPSNYIPDSPGADDVPNQPLPQNIPSEPLSNQPMKIKLPVDSEAKKQSFALTPLDKGFFEPEDKIIPQHAEGQHEGGQSIEITPPRKTRQNPNLGRTKNLIAENLDRLRIGLANKEYRIPVSLLPTNLRWLKINHPKNQTSTHEAPDSTDKPGHNHALEATNDPADSIYGIALIAAVGAGLSMTIVGLAFGWYTLSRKAKAAADVDYPAYGVTGPSIDPSGDRKLAHSAHMYHYQHQKQQIIAMERNGLEQRNGSVSDPESEEENEEGDYTVYECPGFATTGEIEVKNPLFSEDPTPATPGKCELVKPQPKD